MSSLEAVDDDPKEKLQSVESPALAMGEVLYASLEVVYHMCACSAPAVRSKSNAEFV